MILFKIYYHLVAILKKILFSIVYNKHIKFGKKTTFRKGFSLVIEDNGKIEIGNNCFFNNYCSLNCKEIIHIGDNCIFGENVKIYDHNHRFSKKDIIIKKQGYKKEKIVIGNNCWIGSNVTILKGVEIGDNVVIGAGCVITDNIESNTILKNNQQYKIEKIIYKEIKNENRNIDTL